MFDAVGHEIHIKERKMMAVVSNCGGGDAV